MIRVCIRCKKVMGEKEPLDDKSLTHGMCDECYHEKRGRHITENLLKVLKQGDI